MSTSQLTAAERMALISGNIMKVQILDNSNDEDEAILRVTIPSNTISMENISNSKISNERYTNKSKKYTEYNKLPATGLREIPIGAYALNNLKTGQKLSGKVVQSTPQAAFIAAEVYRKAKGGLFVPVNGLLRKDDISTELLSPSRRYSKQGPLMDKGANITVYVKQVFKNSGYAMLYMLK